MRHGRGGRGAVPVLFTGRNPDHIAGPDGLDRATPALHEAGAGRHHQGLPEGMDVPGCAGTGLEGNADAQRARRVMRLKQGINTDRAGEVVGRAFGGSL